MAAMPPDELEVLLATTADSVASTQPPLDLTHVRAEIAQIQRQGHSLVRGTRHPDVSAIAAAILDSEGSPFAAISISMPTHHLTPELVEPLAESVIAAARECSSAR